MTPRDLLKRCQLSEREGAPSPRRQGANRASDEQVGGIQRSQEQTLVQPIRTDGSEDARTFLYTLGDRQECIT